MGDKEGRESKMGGGPFTGWKKFFAPNSFVQNEEALKTMDPPSSLTYQYVIDQLEILSRSTADANMKAQYSYIKADMELDRAKSKFSEDFIVGFIQWILGTSNKNVVFDIPPLDPNGELPNNADKYPVLTPWGNKPYTFPPDVKDFIDSIVDQKVIAEKFIAKLKLRWPKNLPELWFWYKYIVHQQAIDGTVIQYARFIEPYEFMPPDKLPFNPHPGAHNPTYPYYEPGGDPTQLHGPYKGESMGVNTDDPYNPNPPRYQGLDKDFNEKLLEDLQDDSLTADDIVNFIKKKGYPQLPPNQLRDFNTWLLSKIDGVQDQQKRHDLLQRFGYGPADNGMPNNQAATDYLVSRMTSVLDKMGGLGPAPVSVLPPELTNALNGINSTLGQLKNSIDSQGKIEMPDLKSLVPLAATDPIAAKTIDKTLKGFKKSMENNLKKIEQAITKQQAPSVVNNNTYYQQAAMDLSPITELNQTLTNLKIPTSISVDTAKFESAVEKLEKASLTVNGAGEFVKKIKNQLNGITLAVNNGVYYPSQTFTDLVDRLEKLDFSASVDATQDLKDAANAIKNPGVMNVNHVQAPVQQQQQPNIIVQQQPEQQQQQQQQQQPGQPDYTKMEALTTAIGTIPSSITVNNPSIDVTNFNTSLETLKTMLDGGLNVTHTINPVDLESAIAKSLAPYLKNIDSENVKGIIKTIAEENASKPVQQAHSDTIADLSKAFGDTVKKSVKAGMKAGVDAMAKSNREHSNIIKKQLFDLHQAQMQLNREAAAFQAMTAEAKEQYTKIAHENATLKQMVSTLQKTSDDAKLLEKLTSLLETNESEMEDIKETSSNNQKKIDLLSQIAETSVQNQQAFVGAVTTLDTTTKNIQSELMQQKGEFSAVTNALSRGQLGIESAIGTLGVISHKITSALAKKQSVLEEKSQISTKAAERQRQRFSEVQNIKSADFYTVEDFEDKSLAELLGGYETEEVDFEEGKKLHRTKRREYQEAKQSEILTDEEEEKVSGEETEEEPSLRKLRRQFQDGPRDDLVFEEEEEVNYEEEDYEDYRYQYRDFSDDEIEDREGYNLLEAQKFNEMPPSDRGTYVEATAKDSHLIMSTVANTGAAGNPVAVTETSNLLGAVIESKNPEVIGALISGKSASVIADISNPDSPNTAEEQTSAYAEVGFELAKAILSTSPDRIQVVLAGNSPEKAKAIINGSNAIVSKGLPSASSSPSGPIKPVKSLGQSQNSMQIISSAEKTVKNVPLSKRTMTLADLEKRENTQEAKEARVRETDEQIQLLAAMDELRKQFPQADPTTLAVKAKVLVADRKKEKEHKAFMSSIMVHGHKRENEHADKAFIGEAAGNTTTETTAPTDEIDRFGEKVAKDYWDYYISLSQSIEENTGLSLKNVQTMATGFAREAIKNGLRDDDLSKQVNADMREALKKLHEDKITNERNAKFMELVSAGEDQFRDFLRNHVSPSGVPDFKSFAGSGNGEFAFVVEQIMADANVKDATAAQQTLSIMKDIDDQYADIKEVMDTLASLGMEDSGAYTKCKEMTKKLNKLLGGTIENGMASYANLVNLKSQYYLKDKLQFAKYTAAYTTGLRCLASQLGHIQNLKKQKPYHAAAKDFKDLIGGEAKDTMEMMDEDSVPSTLQRRITGTLRRAMLTKLRVYAEEKQNKAKERKRQEQVNQIMSGFSVVNKRTGEMGQTSPGIFDNLENYGRLPIVGEDRKAKQPLYEIPLGNGRKARLNSVDSRQYDIYQRQFEADKKEGRLNPMVKASNEMNNFIMSKIKQNLRMGAFSTEGDYDYSKDRTDIFSYITAYSTREEMAIERKKKKEEVARANAINLAKSSANKNKSFGKHRSGNKNQGKNPHPAFMNKQKKII